VRGSWDEHQVVDNFVVEPEEIPFCPVGFGLWVLASPALNGIYREAAKLSTYGALGQSDGWHESKYRK
jgi:hypothetical protein